MKFQTIIPLKVEEPQIDYNSKILLLGSCFSENIGEKFQYYQFRSFVNPLGILFNPISLELAISRAIEKRIYTEGDIFEDKRVYKSFEVHSKLNSYAKEEFLGVLNAAQQLLRKSIFEASHIIITLGTAWVYKHRKTGAVVANCHKIPQQEFSKHLLSVEEILFHLREMERKIFSVNSNAQLIFTISPVRHIKDGFFENNVSKAHLITALHQHLQEGVSKYFAAYELMMDELRDYRFYADDMLHPSPLAIRVIWGKFSTCWISSESKSLQKEIAAIRSGLLHKPINCRSEDYIQFKENLEKRIASVQKVYPHMQFSD